MNCDLCASDEAIENGVLCLACREAIHRLQAIVDAERTRENNAEPLATATGLSEEGLSSRIAKPESWV
jgi:hypothetical protein